MASYDVTNKKGFIANNKGKALVHIYQEDIYEPAADKVYPQLADSLTIMAIPQNTSQLVKPKVKTPPLPKNYWKAIKQPDFQEQWFLAIEL